MDVIFSSNGEWIHLCYDASLLQDLIIGTLVLLHADIRRNKISSFSFSFHHTYVSVSYNKVKGA